MAKKMNIVERTTRGGPGPVEAETLKDVRQKIKEEFPPARPPRRSAVAVQISTARKSLGLSWYALAKKAGIPNPNTVRDIEKGKDVLVSNLQSVAKVLQLKLDLTRAAKKQPAAVVARSSTKRTAAKKR